MYENYTHTYEYTHDVAILVAADFIGLVNIGSCQQMSEELLPFADKQLLQRRET